MIKRDNQQENMVCFEEEKNQIKHIFSIRNPEKLTFALRGIPY
ncbi:hypothetical protein [Ferdinandcohnia sp. SAFN-114]